MTSNVYGLVIRHDHCWDGWKTKINWTKTAHRTQVHISLVWLSIEPAEGLSSWLPQNPTIITKLASRLLFNIHFDTPNRLHFLCYRHKKHGKNRPLVRLKISSRTSLDVASTISTLRSDDEVGLLISPSECALSASDENFSDENA